MSDPMVQLLRQLLEIMREQQREIEEIRRSDMSLLWVLHEQYPNVDWGGSLHSYEERSAAEHSPSRLSTRIDELLRQLGDANAR